MHGRLALLPGEAGRTAGGAFLCTGAPAAHPHLRAHAGLPSLSAYIGSPAPADGLAAPGAARTHRQTRGARYLGLPWPRLRHGRYDRPACPQFLARAVSPRRHRRARAPRRPWDAGSKSRCQLLSFLPRSGPAAGDVGLDAQHDVHGEDAGDCRDAGGRRVQRDLPTLSVPRLGPLRIHKVVLLRPRFQGPAQCQARFSVIQHRNRLIPQALAAAIAPFVHWDIRAQTAGIYLLIH